jgi:hypothetical protein
LQPEPKRARRVSGAAPKSTTNLSPRFTITPDDEALKEKSSGRNDGLDTVEFLNETRMRRNVGRPARRKRTIKPAENTSG